MENAHCKGSQCPVAGQEKGEILE